MQLITLIFVFFTYQGTNFFIYNLAYLELVPKLLCSTDGVNYHICGTDLDWTADKSEVSNYASVYKNELCTEHKIREDIYWKVDYSDKQSFHNWMTDESMYCESSIKIGLFGSFYFAGYAMSGIILKFSDHFGRLSVIRVGLVIQLLV